MGAVKVNPDGSIIVASMQEALELQGLILARQQEARPRVRKKAAAAKVNGKYSAKIIRALTPHSGKEIDSEQLIKVLGVDTTTALGPKIRHLKATFEQDGLSLDNYLVGKKEGRGPRTWSVK